MENEGVTKEEMAAVVVESNEEEPVVEKTIAEKLNDAGTTTPPAGGPVDKTDDKETPPSGEPPVKTEEEGDKPVDKTGDETDDTKTLPPEEQAGVQKRLDAMRAKQGAAERRAAKAEDELAEIKKDADAKAAEAGGKSDELVEPKQEDYADYDKYQTDLRAYDKAIIKKEVEADFAEKATAASEKKVADATHAAQEVAMEAFNTQIDVARTKFKDFDEVCLAEPYEFPVTKDTGAAMMASEVGAEIFYHLGKNHDEAHRIAALPAIEQAVAVGRLEAKIKGVAPAKIETKTPGAPAPIKTVTGSSGTVEVDPEKMPDEEWYKWREKTAKD